MARPAPPEERAAISPVRLTAGARWLAASFLSGFALLALEVIWFRFLSMFVIGVSETFALLLGVVLAGIALGGLLASVWLSRDPQAHRFAAAIALASGMALVISYTASPWMVPYDTRGRVDDALELLRFGIPVMLPVCLLSGVFFTLVGAALREEQPSEAATAGMLTFANTVGAAFGPLVGGFVLLPTLGMERSFFLIALLYGAIALLLLAARAAPRGITLGAAAAFVLVAAFFPFGNMRDIHFLKGLDLYMQGARVEATREGVNETIIYLASMMLDKPLHYRMLTNGYSMSASMMAGRRYMKLYVYLPMAIHPEVRSALLISYGIGSTAKALTDSKSIESIDVVDISRDILEMGSIVFPDPTEHPLNDPRVRVHVEDGRYFLQTTTQHFDLITAEPPPPAYAGVVNLYTREYFRLLYDRLAEGGIATYWLPIASVSEATGQAVLRAFCDAFEERQWRDSLVAAEMKGLGLERPEQLGALFIGDSDFLAKVTEGVPSLTDDRPKRMRPRVPIGVGWYPLFERWANPGAARARFHESEYIAGLWPEPMRGESLDYFDVQRVINRAGSFPRDRDDSAIADIHELLTETSLSTPALWLMGGFSDVLRIVDEATPEEAAHPALQYYHGLRLLSERRYAEAAGPVSRGLEIPHLRQDALRYAVYALCMSGQCDRAERWARRVFAGPTQPSPDPVFWIWMGENFGLDGST
jgi:predicted membrane-bound spermidine synthase